MAKKNRTEIFAEIVTKFVAALTLTVHKSFLNDDLVNSLVLEKDVIATETPGGGLVIIDYSNKDTANVSITANLSVSFTNIENGAVKYLHITKVAANTISFTGSTDVSSRKSYINTTPTVVQYQVRNKNGVITVDSINIDNAFSEAWQTPVYATGYSGAGTNPLRFRIINGNNLQISGVVEQTSQPVSTLVFTLPSGYRPSVAQAIAAIEPQGGAATTGVDIPTAGTFTLKVALGANNLISFNKIIPLD